MYFCLLLVTKHLICAPLHSFSTMESKRLLNTNIDMTSTIAGIVNSLKATTCTFSSLPQVDFNPTPTVCIPSSRYPNSSNVNSHFDPPSDDSFLSNNFIPIMIFSQRHFPFFQRCWRLWFWHKILYWPS